MPYDRRSFLGSLTGVAAGAASAAPAAAQRGSLENGLQAAVDEMPLVNTHEHIIPEQERVGSHVDFFTLASHYCISDLMSAGLSREDLKLVGDEKASVERRWQVFEPHGNNARFTGYSQALRIAIRDIYEVEEISGDTVGLINNRVLAMNKLGLYEDVLIRRSKIVYSVLDDYWNPAPVRPDPKFFVYASEGSWINGGIEEILG